MGLFYSFYRIFFSQGLTSWVVAFNPRYPCEGKTVAACCRQRQRWLWMSERSPIKLHFSVRVPFLLMPVPRRVLSRIPGCTLDVSWNTLVSLSTKGKNCHERHAVSRVPVLFARRQAVQRVLEHPAPAPFSSC